MYDDEYSHTYEEVKEEAMATDTKKEKVIIDRNDRNPINAVFWVFGIIILIFLFFMLFGGMGIFSGGETSTPAPVTPAAPTGGQ